MEQIKIANKGYTLYVSSWENDGDNYQNKSVIVETEEEARKIVFICETLFQSSDCDELAIGNMAYYDDPDSVIADYIDKYPELNTSPEEINTLASKLLGNSEFYTYRVCESVVVAYCPEDVYAEQITF